MASSADERPTPTPGSVYGTRVAERLRSCTFAGPLAVPDAAGEAGSLECGSFVRIELRMSGGVAAEARYQAHGCPATLAAASEVCARVAGQPLLQAAAVSSEEICAALGLVPDKEYTAGIALDALHEALTAVIGSSPGGVDGPVGDGVLVGMSGGVDSAVAALLLKRQGRRVAGITLTFWNDPRVDEERSCCSPENVRRARRVAHRLGIPHVTVDARGAFYQEVVEYFVSEYSAGRTPNPCAKCNSRVRLGLLVDVARRFGFVSAATGHYARLVGAPPRLARGIDRNKDQSYVLAEVAPQVLEHLIFPLGGMRKPDVRGLAAEAGLEGHSAPESQEICFVPDDDHRRFLSERLGPLPGDIVDTAGRVRGRHEGTFLYTIGQRKGLGIAAPEPLYVVGLDAAERRVLVGTAAEALVGRVSASSLVRHREPGEGPFTVQVRSSGAALPVARLQAGDGRLTVWLSEPASGVAPGQTLVLYEEDRIVTAGTIEQTGAWPGE